VPDGVAVLDPAGARAELLRFLLWQGFTVEPIGTSENLRVGSSDDSFEHRPVFVLPGDLLWEYLRDMSDSYRDEPDPLGEALSMTGIHAVEFLTTDHGDGRNALRALGFRRDPTGRVEFFEEKDLPERPHLSGPPGDLGWRAERS
jgi:hypothetical protein